MTIPSWSMVIMLAFYFSRKNVRLAMNPIIHEDYQKDFQYNNDIALLKLAEEVHNQFLNIFFLSQNFLNIIFSRSKSQVDTAIYTPACLAAVDADYTGQNGRVYGEYKCAPYICIWSSENKI